MIEIDNVSFSYTKEKNTLEDIDLTIPQGELILLCGESGCGKTTITKLINGLIPHFTAGEQLTGTVRVDGTTVSDTKMYEFAKVVGSVFQNPKSQFFNLDSDSEISFGLENEGLPPQEIQMRVTQAVQDLNISHLEHRNIFSMSGGEKQSLAFASVYAMQPSIFVLDEPSANLDAPAIETLRRQIKQVKKNGHTIVIAEHRLYFLADLADRIVYLKNGKINQIWKPKEFLSLSKDRQISLQAMKDSNKQRDGMLPSELAALLELEVEDIKHQGGRLKGVAEGNVGKRSVEIVGEAHEMNYKKVMRYLRLNSLVPELLDKVDDKKMGFMPAVELSYIKPKNQRLIAVSIDGEQASPSLAQAKRLRELDKEGKLNGDVIDGILSEQKKEDRGVIISTAELEKYFGKEVTPAKMKEQIMSLLDDWKEKQPPELAKAPKKQELDK